MNFLPVEHYSRDYLKTLFLQDINKAVDYVKLYFYDVIGGLDGLYKWECGTFKVYKHKDLYKLLPDVETIINTEDNKSESKTIIKHDKVSLKQIIKNTAFEPYELDFNINKPILYEENNKKMLNMFYHYDYFKKDLKPYNDYNEDIKSNVQFVINHFREVLCNDKDEQFIYFMNWIKNIITLKRNKTAILLKGQQGTGKSLAVNFIDSLIPDDLVCITENFTQQTKFNSEFKNKLILHIEEMPATTVNEWEMISSILKSYITEDKITIEQKGKDSKSLNNYLNVIVCTNRNAIKIEEGDRRWVCLEINNKYKDNKEYFNKLSYVLKDVDVQNAFKSYLVETYTEYFDPRRIPDSIDKQILRLQAIPKPIQFMKEKYLRYKQDVDIILKDLVDEYIKWARETKSTVKMTTYLMRKLLVEHGLNDYLKPDNHKMWHLIISYKDMLDLFKSKLWIDLNEIDEEGDPEPDIIEVNEEENNNNDIIREKDLLINNLMNQLLENKIYHKQINNELLLLKEQMLKLLNENKKLKECINTNSNTESDEESENPFITNNNDDEFNAML